MKFLRTIADWIDPTRVRTAAFDQVVRENHTRLIHQLLTSDGNHVKARLDLGSKLTDAAVSNIGLRGDKNRLRTALEVAHEHVVDLKEGLDETLASLPKRSNKRRDIALVVAAVEEDLKHIEEALTLTADPVAETAADSDGGTVFAQAEAPVAAEAQA